MNNTFDCSGSDNPGTSTPAQEDNYAFLTGSCTSEYYQGLEDALKAKPLRKGRSKAFQDGYHSLGGGNEVTVNPIATLHDAWL
jgi:hypothetical protein